MLKRLGGLLRDAWWIPLIVVFGSLFIGGFIHPLVGVVTFVSGCLTLVYFALLRYDDEGREKRDDFRL
jgi:hypothetical protein